MRIKQDVNKQELIKVVNALEEKNTYPNLAHLYAAIAETEWAKSHSKPITASVASLRIKEFKIETKTKPGKRGRPSGVPRPTGGKTRKRKTRSLGELARTTPVAYNRLVERIRGGSKVAAIKLKCLECSAYQRTEIRDCVVSACALWSIRPYQKTLEETLDDDEVGD